MKEYNILWDEIRQRATAQFYAQRCADLYGQLALDIGLTTIQRRISAMCQQIIHQQGDYSLLSQEWMLEHIAADLELTFLSMAESESDDAS